ncbi:MAG: HXXEE domain-containing protein [Eubacterium sp.]|nr:HXXEE domain-containing protein [Eubacterium sp.]
MKEYILLLPIIFIIHDMEEVVGFGRFFRDNPYLFEKYPNVTKAYRGFTTEGFAAAVYEEFIPFFGVSLTAYFFPYRFLYALWFGLFISLTAHFFIHIGQTIYLKKYIPSFATSVIGLPVSILILIKCTAYISFDLVSILIMAAGIIFMIVNLKIAHILMHSIKSGYQTVCKE